MLRSRKQHPNKSLSAVSQLFCGEFTSSPHTVVPVNHAPKIPSVLSGFFQSVESRLAWGRGVAGALAVLVVAAAMVVVPTTDRAAAVGPGLTLQSYSVAPLTFQAGATLSYTATVRNSGDVALSDIRVQQTFTGSTASPLSLTCPAAQQPLQPASTLSCTADYTVTQADVDNGRIVSTVLASGQPPTPAGGTVPARTETAQGLTATSTLAVTQTPGLSVVKSATPSSVTRAGDRVSYSYVVTNTGNVTMSDIRITDDLAALSVVCPTVGQPLAPGRTLVCTAGPYTTTQADIDRGRVESRAVASGQAPTPAGGTAPARTSSAASSSGVVTVAQTPGLSVVKSATPSAVTRAGDRVSYSYAVTNTGNVAMSAFRVVDDLAGLTATCPAADQPLAPNGTLTCTAGPYVVTQADIDRGSRIVISAVASGQAPTRPGEATPARTVAAASPSRGVTIVQSPALSVVKSATPSSVSRAGERVSYSFVVTNSGNMTMS